MAAHKQRFCVRGHDTDVVGRRTSTGQCKECYRIYFREYRKRVKIRKLNAIYQRNYKHRQKIKHYEQEQAETTRILEEKTVALLKTRQWIYPNANQYTQYKDAEGAQYPRQKYKGT